MASPKLVKMTVKEAKEMQSAPNVLKDFNGLIRVPVARINNSETLLFFPMSYQVGGVENVENKIKTIAGFDLVCAFKGTKIKVYLARLIEDKSPLWLDFMGDWEQLETALMAELSKDKANFVAFTPEELASISQKNEDGTSRSPMECENGTIVFGYVTIKASREGRVVKYGANVVATGTTVKVGAKKEEEVEEPAGY